MSKTLKLTSLALGAALVVTGAAGCSTSKGGKVVATTTVLGSIAGQIAKCAGVESETLMGPGTDPHDFNASSAQVASMSKAALVITNGFDLESGMKDVLANVKKDGVKTYEVAPDVDPIAWEEHGDEEGGDGEEHGDKDPHFWNDASRGAKAAENIGKKLKEATGNDKFESCGNSLRDELKKLDDEVKQTLAPIAQNRRVLVTDHEAMGYFAKAYNFDIAGVAIESLSTNGEPNSAAVSKLVGTIKEKQVPAIFSNTSLNSKVMDTVAKEAGSNVKVVPLFVESTGDKDSGADTYQGMMRTNAKRIADALK